LANKPVVEEDGQVNRRNMPAELNYETIV